MRNSGNCRIPNLPGCTCTAFLAEETWWRGRCNNSYNAFYMQFGSGRWHRFRVNCGGISWQVVESPHRLPLDDWEFHLTVLDDENVIDGRIHKIEYWEREPFGYDSNDEPPMQFFDDSAIRIQFLRGFVLEIRYHFHDTTLDMFQLTPTQARRHNHYKSARIATLNTPTL